MPIIAGHTEADPDDRDEAVAVMRDLVTRARDAPGPLNLAVTADPVDPGRVNIFERWELLAALETFRGSGPDTEQRPAMLTVAVQEYDIADVRPVLRKEPE